MFLIFKLYSSYLVTIFYIRLKMKQIEPVNEQPNTLTQQNCDILVFGQAF